MSASSKLSDSWSCMIYYYFMYGTSWHTLLSIFFIICYQITKLCYSTALYGLLCLCRKLSYKIGLTVASPALTVFVLLVERSLLQLASFQAFHLCFYFVLHRQLFAMFLMATATVEIWVLGKLDLAAPNTVLGSLPPIQQWVKIWKVNKLGPTVTCSEEFIFYIFCFFQASRAASTAQNAGTTRTAPLPTPNNTRSDTSTSSSTLSLAEKIRLLAALNRVSSTNEVTMWIKDE